MTFADFAISEIRFRKHFRVAPPETWNEKMVPLAEFLELAEDDRVDLFPYVWSVNREGLLMRLLVAGPMIDSCQDRMEFWKMLRSIAGANRPTNDRGQMEAEIRGEVASKMAANLVQLITGEQDVVAAAPTPAADASPAAAATAPA